MAVRKRFGRLVRGREQDPPWARPAILGVLVATAVAYTWSLDASGYGNEYYAAAAYSGSTDWTAWLFGSFDSASFISVDKPPVSLWVTGLSVRVFGISSWTILLPQAIAGVVSVGLLYGTVARWKGHLTGLLAAGAYAVTPIVLVMFRYNNPDAVLTLILIAAIAITFRAVERGSGWLLAAAGALVGAAFLTKTTQALLVIPAIALTYLMFAPTSVRTRVLHGLGAATAAIAAAGWWVVLAVTSSAAPYAGQTDSGSFIDYIFGVNGLDRISGSGGGPAGGRDPFGGSGGWGRLFNLEVGGQISWLIPLAITGLVLALAVGSARRAEQAGWVLWGAVFVTHSFVFSLISGVFHPYYSMTMAPSIAALAAAGAVDGWSAWRDRTSLWWLLPVGVAATGMWSAVLLSRAVGFLPWLGPSIVLGALTVLTVMVGSRLAARAETPWRFGVAALAVAVSISGPVAFAFASIGTDYSGGDPAAGPAETGQPAVARLAGFDEGRPIDGPQDGGVSVAPDTLPFSPFRGDAGGGRPDARPIGPPQGAGAVQAGAAGVSDDLIDFLLSSYDDETWLVATVGSRPAASIILETGLPAMAMGGFSGGDPTPTTSELTTYIGEGDLRFILLSGGNRRRGEDWWAVVEMLCEPVEGFAQLFDCASSPFM